MKKVALWASAHEMTEEQKQSVLKKGFEIVNLKEKNLPLYEKLTNLSMENNRSILAAQLLSMPVDIILQPAGDPAFHFALGLKMGFLLDDNKDCPEVEFAFSKRESKDLPQEDGSIKKVSIFKFEGWI